ncbi:MAG TPA: bifunctional YncE family protein/alkaline phosphatase family protein [Candidatus Dormibacteraeota bacterium]
MSKRLRGFIVLALVLAAGAALPSVLARQPRAQTATALPTGGALTPAGAEVKPAANGDTFGLLPQSIAVSPDGKLMATSDSGNDTKSVTIVDPATNSVVQHLDLNKPTFAGLAFADDNTLFLSAGTYDGIWKLTRPSSAVPFALASSTPLPTGYFPAQIAFQPGENPPHTLYVANDMSNNLTVLDTSLGSAVTTLPTGDHPYGVALTGDRLYVSNWGNGTVSEFLPASAATTPTGASLNPAGYTDLHTIAPLPTTAGRVAQVGRHPSALLADPANHRLYVTDGNDDAVSFVDMTTMTEVARVSVAPPLKHSATPFSSAPGALALYQHYLFVALGGDNAIAVIDVTAKKPSRALLGYIPTGWYPSALQIMDGVLYYTNAKGDGPNSGSAGGNGVLFQGRGVPPHGSMWYLPVSAALSNLAGYTYEVYQDNNWTTLPGAVSAQDSPLRHIKHVVYVLRENKTYDEEFSDIAGGNGQPCRTPGATATYDAANENYRCSDGKPAVLFYGKEVTPNNHALAQKYALLDNFYVDVETSIIGHQWANASQLSDFAQRTYGSTEFWTSQEPGFFPQDGAFDVAYPGDGYIFSDVAASGHSVRAYSGGYDGADISARPTNLEQILEDTDLLVPIGLDSGLYPDTLRVQEFERDVDTRGLADFSFLWLPDDHTTGGLPGNLNPQSQVATNDIATGQLVDYLSHSQYWPDTAVFVIEDDPQSGSDHVSGYRSIFMVASPWAKRSYHSSAHYDMSSMLRTFELIFGAPPLSQTDLAVKPMTDLFTDRPDASIYSWLTPQVPPTLNPPVSPFAQATRKFDFTRVDAVGFDSFVRQMDAAGDYGWWLMDPAYGVTPAQQWRAFMASGLRFGSLFKAG